ncbi:MAG: hypothetical protein OZ913_04305 [Ignavibacteriaceae bacterium]|jgi:hypothetical protein|nr:MAG: hypothetical protein EDM69_00560 [Chlorobiota bacterium]KXK02307.1 MAG: hypothetical protein UZ04_CHB001002014 [Chlorobi bacterium OLB4]MBV6398837.1 hypothetical protein [Ignavibacteria bacterium]MCC6884991.1 hypothetical protein [Ignavibacteriales bacterium]MCE7952218.1 hypothetical protein [Chlorobi bacterium CHB7]MDL1886225.1 hypothetical protein [Ignavibacteria bacterium CHB1]MEB2329504.1 hypothetical protein [Ignavibacteriaceae bacterium]OQY76944.1 MAG: hypothetical protein B6D4
MKNGNKENLIYDLPDYIEGKIDNPEKVILIESLIKNDSDFRKEYEELKNVLVFAHEVEFEPPGDFYFNNLLTNIRNKIDDQSSTGESTFWYSIKPFILKYALPVIVIAIFSIFYFSGLFQNNTERFTEHIGNTQNKSITENNNQPIISDTKDVQKVKTQVEHVESRIKKEPQKRKSNVTTHSNDEPVVNTESEIEEYVEDIAQLYTVNTTYMSDYDVSDLSPEDQESILESLTKSGL